MDSNTPPRDLRRLVQAMTLGMFTVLLGLGIALHGCSAGSVAGSSGGTGPTGSVALNHDLPGIDEDAALFVYSGFDGSGDHVFGPVTLPRGARHVLENVPTGVVTITVEYRTAGGILVSWGSTAVQVSTEVVVETTPSPAAGSTVLQVQNTTSSSPRMAVAAYVAPTNLDNLKVYSLTSSGPVAMTPMPDGSNWRYVDMGPNDQYELYSIEPNSSGVVDNQLNSFIVAFGDPTVFTTQPYCPGVFGLYVNGMNYFECTLNVTTGETLDISLNQGANSYIGVQCSPTPSASPTAVPGWATNNGLDPVSSFQNSFLNVAGSYDDNCCLPGVFAFGLSNCTAGPSSCGSSGPFCSNSAIHCQVQRNPGQVGGVVLVQYNGLMNLASTPTPLCSPSPSPSPSP